MLFGEFSNRQWVKVNKTKIPKPELRAKMFIQNLNPEQQKSFLAYAGMLIEADEKISSEETTALDFLKSQCDPNIQSESIQAMDPNQDFRELEGKLNDNKAKVSFMLELIGLAMIDFDYAPQEKELIEKVGRVLQLSNEVLEDLENWVSRQVQLINEANLLMGE